MDEYTGFWVDQAGYRYGFGFGDGDEDGNLRGSGYGGGGTVMVTEAGMGGVASMKLVARAEADTIPPHTTIKKVNP